MPKKFGLDWRLDCSAHDERLARVTTVDCARDQGYVASCRQKIRAMPTNLPRFARDQQKSKTQSQNLAHVQYVQQADLPQKARDLRCL